LARKIRGACAQEKDPRGKRVARLTGEKHLYAGPRVKVVVFLYLEGKMERACSDGDRGSYAGRRPNFGQKRGE